MVENSVENFSTTLLKFGYIRRKNERNFPFAHLHKFFAFCPALERGRYVQVKGV